MEDGHDHSLTVRAAELLGSPLEAEDWFRRPASALGNQRPVDLVRTAEGRRRLDDYLRKLEHGGGLLQSAFHRAHEARPLADESSAALSA